MIGFPLGANTTEVKLFEALEALRAARQPETAAKRLLWAARLNIVVDAKVRN